jgi:ribosome maturation factor RimP
MELKEEITSLVEEQIQGSENFLVEVKISPGKIVVIIDHPKGVKIEDCVSINRFLQNHYDSTNVFEQHELEVGSPGMEEPLKVQRQYEKRIGREVSVLTFDGLKRTGTLMSIDEEGIVLNEDISVKNGNKKEKQKQLNNIPFSNIKETRVIFSFDKIN